jgi:transposase
MMPPAYVKPYVKRQKNDTTDAEAICEAVTRPNMRFVSTKTVEQQSCLPLQRPRLIPRRTLLNARNLASSAVSVLTIRWVTITASKVASKRT